MTNNLLLSNQMKLTRITKALLLSFPSLLLTTTSAMAADFPTFEANELYLNHVNSSVPGKNLIVNPSAQLGHCDIEAAVYVLADADPRKADSNCTVSVYWGWGAQADKQSGGKVSSHYAPPGITAAVTTEWRLKIAQGNNATLTEAVNVENVNELYIEFSYGANTPDNTEGALKPTVMLLLDNGEEILIDTIVPINTLTYSYVHSFDTPYTGSVNLQFNANSTLKIFADDVFLSTDVVMAGEVEVDTDGDGVNDNLDAFPDDVAASIDSDEDGAPDDWNVGYDAEDSTTGLLLDVFVNDPEEQLDSDNDGVGDNADAFPNNPAKTTNIVPVVTAPANVSITASDENGIANTDVTIAAFLAAASATDVEDGSLTVTNDAPNPIPVGETTITFSATDSDSNTSTATALVTVFDAAAPPTELELAVAGISDSTLKSCIQDHITTGSFTEISQLTSLDCAGSKSGTYGVTIFGINEGGITSLVGLEQFSSISTLKLGYNTQLADISALADLDLKVLKLEWTAIDNDALDVIANFTNLTNLNLDYTFNVTDAAKITETLATFTKMQELIIRSIGYPNYDWESDADLNSNTVKISQITDGILGDLSFLANMPLLKTYNGAGNIYSSGIEGFNSTPLLTNITLSSMAWPDNMDLSPLMSFDQDQLKVLFLQGNESYPCASILDVVDHYAPDGKSAHTLADWGGAEAFDFNLDNSVNGYIRIRTQCLPAPDSDGDGENDDLDAFPNDIAASIDSDGDGVPDSWNIGKSSVDSTTGLTYLDAFENDIAASIDSDGDDVPDSWNTDKSAVDSTTGLTYLDAFENDIAASIDTDGDESPDSWNDGYDAGDSTTGLVIDAFPNDDTKFANTLPVITAPTSIIDVPQTNAAGTLATNSTIAAFLSGHTASDIDGSVSVAVTVGGEAVTDSTIFPAGLTTVTFTVTDSSGIEVATSATVTVSDLEKPVITLVGTAEAISVGGEYLELGATALDNVDGDSLVVIIDSSAVDTATPGSYVVTYNVTDYNTNTAVEVTRIISVVDVVKPALSIPADLTIDASSENGTAATQTDIAAFLIAATAIDDIDENVVVEVAINGATPEQFDVFPMGETIVTFTAKDAANNITTKTATITVADLSAPVITLLGESSQTVALHGSYIDEGATAFDNVDGDITNEIIIDESAVITSVEGIYDVTYTVSDALGNEQVVTRSITVQDAAAPVVTAPESITVEATSPAGAENTNEQIAAFLIAASAEDTVDGPLEASAAINTPAVFSLGETAVIFESTDEEGYKGTSEATINVVDTTAPLITLAGDNSVTIALGGEYSDAGATVTDIYDEHVVVEVTGLEAINTSVQDTYTITYTAVDNEGNAAETVTRTVIVQNEQAPTVTPPHNITVAAIDASGTPFTDTAFDAFFADASAVDFSGSTLEVTNDAQGIVALNTPTTVTFTATDGDLEGTATATVTVTDQTAPVITLIGGAIELIVGADYVEPGVSALDNVDSDITESITVSGSLDTSKAGTYTLTYDVSDTAENAAEQVSRQVIVLINDIDGDGVIDSEDAFPEDATETTDSDLDGVGDNSDAFPNDASETLDTDGDGTGDNTDTFPEDATENKDSDLDGVGDNADIFPDDATETLDSDGDNVGDNSDAFPENANESVDSDLDGTGDNADFAPNDASETTDTDGDGTGDNADVFPNDATETLDSDLDGVGDFADIDDDNDGIIDEDDAAAFDPLVGDDQAPTINDVDALTVEATGELTTLSLIAPKVTDNNLNAPTIVADLAKALPLGKHSVTWTATDFAGNKTTAEQSIWIIDSTAPEFEALELGQLPIKTINARGLLTDISADIDVVASDSVDGELSAAITGDVKYRAGSHSVTLVATDSSGNTTSVEQVIHINPMVEMARGTNLAPGSHYVLPVTLSDEAAVYPVTIGYQLSGAASGADDISGEVIIESGVSSHIEFDIANSAVANDLLTVTLVSANNAVIADNMTDTSSRFTVIEENIAPTVTLAVEQNGQSVSTIDASGGVVTVKATINDINPLDEHNITWSVDDSALVNLAVDDSALAFEFSPEQLDAGTYDLSLTVVETNTDESFAITLDNRLFVEAELVALSDNTDSDNDGIVDSDEGYSDSDNDGIADYLDDDSNVTRLPISNDSEPMKTMQGLVLSLGDIVRQAGNASAEDASIALDELIENGGEHGETADNANSTRFTPLSTIINFNVSGLTQTGESVPVVIPLADNQFIPQNAVYKKYTLAKGWFDFVEDANNSLSSAMTDSDGNCPAPLSDVYVDGLQAGDNCIQLTIEDGGENDADNQANGVIKDPGVLAINGANEVPVINMASPLTAGESTQVTLDASSTTDADNDDLTYVWTQTSGRDVELIGQDSAVLSFMAPAVTNTKALSFSLAVNDGAVTVTKDYTVLVNNVVVMDVAIDTHNEQFIELSPVRLKADVSINSLFVPSYLWQQVSGPEVDLADVDVTALSIKFVAPEVTNDEVIEFTLTVSQGNTDVSTTTSFTVVKAEVVADEVVVEEPVVGDKKKSSGGSMAWLLAASAFLLRLRRRGINTK